MVTIIGLIRSIIELTNYFLKRRDKNETPQKRSKADIEEMDDALAHGDADRIALEFDELFQDADRNDPGQHEGGQDGSRNVERSMGRDGRVSSKDLPHDENF